jgi:hypothetical protein
MSVEEIFKKHWEEKEKLTLKTVAEQSGNIEEVIKAYEDRVIFELLQNALDKAKKTTLVQVIDNMLYIANDDGKRMTFTQDGNSDFEALCSIHNSNKNSSEAIGNKGIGFKSVFSSSSDGSVTIYAKPDKVDEFISFKYYGKIDKNIVEKEEQYRSNKFIQEQLNNKKNFIAGFYYPILLENEKLPNEFKNYVTVIKIPLKDKLNIQLLFSEIKEKHFYFVSTKGDKYKNIKIKFQPKDEDEFSKETSNKEKIIIGSFKDPSILQKLSKEAGLSDKTPNVSIYFNENNTTNIYTYLPTKMKSPFLHCDINSDFQTKENRESMDFDKSGKISKYNKALLTACIELHFLTLSKYLDNFDNSLKFEYIKNDLDKENDLDKDNFWKYLQLNDDPIVKKETIQIIKKIFANDWNKFGDFIAKLAKKYFDEKNNLTIGNFDNFWKVVKTYTEIISPYKKHTRTFKGDLQKYFLTHLLKSKACIVPIEFKDTKVSKQKSLSDKIFFKDDDKDINLSEKLNIYVTSYKFSELEHITLLHKDTQCTIKEFLKYTELLKHFRQIPKDGSIRTDKLDEKAEKNQKEILCSLYQIFNKSKEKKEYVSTHRYSKYITDDKARQSANVENNAYFSISTIFLKVKDKYKPAQLCREKDLDLEDDFYSELKDKDNFDKFLKFLGVSFDKKYIFCEGEIYKNYQKGLDYIPAIVDESIGTLKASEIIPNISIVNLDDNEKKFAWQCYKNNHYEPLLKEIKSKDESLNEIVKSIKSYPKGYLDELIKSLEGDSDLEAKKKLYQVIFNRQLEIDSKDYLVYDNGNIELSHKLENIFIPKTKKDFNLIWKHKDEIKKKFLMAFTDKFNAKDLKLVVVEENG